MGARYAGVHETPAGTNLTILAIESTATVRANIYDLIVGSDATPADVASDYKIARTTVNGASGTAVVEKAIDPLSAAASCNLRGGTMTEPTYEADFLLVIALNQRATFRWVAAPGGELVTALGTAAGAGFRSIASGGTPNTNLAIHWFE